jgi:hypothetical protein
MNVVDREDHASMADKNTQPWFVKIGSQEDVTIARYQAKPPSCPDYGL